MNNFTTLINNMNVYSNIELKANQRVKLEKRTGIAWLEEKQSFTTGDGRRHRVWVRIGIVQ